MPKQATYGIAPRGLGTAFTESEVPPEYATEFRNRFINAAGGAEKRHGVVQLGNVVPGAPNLTGLHELVRADGSVVLFTSGQGRIHRYSDPDYTQVYSGWDSSAKIRSHQMGDKLIFYNGVDRDIFTTDGITFETMRPKIEVGSATAGTNKTGLMDSGVENWVTDTDVGINDLVWNRTQDAYGVITAVVTASVAHTQISPDSTGIGIATATAASGDRYEILDLVELNVVPTDGDNDNIAVTGVGTSAASIVVSAVSNWTNTDIRKGDYIRNTTRSAVTEVTSISTAAIGVVGIAGQTSGDSIILLKSAMPIAQKAHTHFGRRYVIDSRDQRLIRISGPNNPFDMTTGAGTLDSTTFSFGELQPEGDAAVTMASFQRFFVVGGKQNIYLYSGTDPIADETTGTVDFSPVGLFPHGVVSPDAMVSIGNDIAFASQDGLQTISLVSDASTLGRANISDPIKTHLREAIDGAGEDEVMTFHYSHRSWLALKVGSEIYIYNYTPFYGKDSTRQGGDILSTKEGSWSEFDGKLARQNAYFVRRNGDLLCCGAGGKVYRYGDNTSTYVDDGETYTTEYQTGWHTLDEPKKRVNIKKVNYLKLILDAPNVVYTIRGEGGFSVESSDSVLVTADSTDSIGVGVVGQASIGGSSINNIKFPMRLRGEQFRINIKTNDQLGPDVISRLTYYATKHGKR
jgi:hypothetical protein